MAAGSKNSDRREQAPHYHITEPSIIQVQGSGENRMGNRNFHRESQFKLKKNAKLYMWRLQLEYRTYCTRKIPFYNSSILVSAGDIVDSTGSWEFFLPCNNKFCILTVTATHDVDLLQRA